MRRTLLILCFLGAHFTPLMAQSPNVLLFIADDMNWTDSQPYGNSDVITPNMARLAREGRCFDNMFTSTAMCAPTRQQLYTGLYPVRNGAYPNHSQVYPGVKSVAHHFQAIGYRVGLIGKQHYGPAASFPFEYFEGKQHDDGKGNDIDMAQAQEFMEDSMQPFFLVVAENQPHMPWNRGNPSAYEPEKLTVPDYMVDSPFTRDQLTRYYAEITYADSLLGVCLDYLDDSGQADNTIVIFTSEQGAQIPFGKWTCYDLGLKTQFIVRWPGQVAAGSRNTALMQYVDVVPTLYEAVGGNPDTVNVGIDRVAGGNGFDGRSFLKNLLTSSSQHRPQVFGVQTTRGIHAGSACYPVRSVRTARFKYIWNLHSEAPFYNLMTTRPNSLFADWNEATKGNPDRHAWVMKYQQRPEEELYDLKNDPYELHSLAEQSRYQSEKKRLRSELVRWMENQSDKGVATEMRALDRQVNNQDWKSYGGNPCEYNE